MDRVLRHNVRNSVGVIDGFAKQLETDLEDDEHQAAVQTIQDRAQDLAKLSTETRSIRDLFRKRGSQPELTVEQLQQFTTELQDTYPRATITVDVTGNKQTVIPNGSLLRIAVSEAVENAVAHNPDTNPSVNISLTVENSPPRIALEIRDDGPGIPADQWAVLTAGKETPLAHTTGIGLWLIYWTVTALGGTITHTENTENNETDSTGSTLSITVPLRQPTSDS